MRADVAMNQKTKTVNTTVSAIALSVFVTGLAILLLSRAMISDTIFLALFISGILLGMVLYRIYDITEIAFAKGASVKLAKAEEISDKVSLLAEQMVKLFEPVKLGDKPFDEVTHQKFIEETLNKIKSLTKR
jgi:hypothetical protein